MFDKEELKEAVKVDVEALELTKKRYCWASQEIEEPRNTKCHFGPINIDQKA